jgi:hydrogenase large subunit
VEAMLNDQNVIGDALSSGTMWRGIELIVQGRDPREVWAFAERICGVCTTIHALASVRSVENALKIDIPKNASIIRHLMNFTQIVQDHVIHFYHLHALDWVDVVSALKADPAATSALAQKVSPHWPKSSPGYYSDTLATLKKFVDSGQLGIFQNAYWGHPAYKLPPEANLMAVAHYLEALQWQKEVAKIHTVFGGKNPHPNYLVGGVACAINMVDDNAPINMERLSFVKDKIMEAINIVDQLYIPDLAAIASFYPEWTQIGGGLGNFMAYGDMPTDYNLESISKFRFPRGVVLNKNLNEVQQLDLTDFSQVQEEVTHSWYEYGDGKKKLHPWEGQTKAKYSGPKPPYKQLDENQGYSWVKTPRWRGNAVEVGPLARMVIGYASGNTAIKDVVNWGLGATKLPATALFSTLGRTFARGLETKLAAQWMLEEYNNLIANLKAGDTVTANTRNWEPSSWPTEAKGVGFVEAPRGALGHWIKIKDKKTESYQIVVPSTWNASPKDSEGKHGAYEAALIGTKMADGTKPVEILRTIHSFDPCLACATHVMGEDGETLAKIVVR